MNPKDLLKNKSICVLPWTGFELEPNGKVKNCIISTESIGNINNTPIREIVSGTENLKRKEQMMADLRPDNCRDCYLQEKNRKDLGSISSRLYYLREIGAKTDLSLYDDKKNFSLKHVDLRWTNSCNQACVYCSPEFSSKWAQELGVKVKSSKESRQEVKDFVFENIAQLKNVYLAGGEPMLMKENIEFLKLLKDKNPQCGVRVNTNLSTTQTGIFDLLCSLPNVHWTVSVETTEEEYEYVRHLGSWVDFCDNLDVIKKTNHKISFNMLHFILNYQSIFGCVDFLKNKGFHDNSFIIGPLYRPPYYNLLNLPNEMVDGVISTIKKRLSQRPRGYLKNSYENLLTYFTNTTWQPDIKNFLHQTSIIDERRNKDWRQVFPDLFRDLNA